MCFARAAQVLPQYQVAHERAIFKSMALVADTKKGLQQLAPVELIELRSQQRAPNEHTLDLMSVARTLRLFTLKNVKRLYTLLTNRKLVSDQITDQWLLIILSFSILTYSLILSLSVCLFVY